ncbi:response regulator [Variovorax atrisoli]|uniref:response regulator n=1 Tax=Variovorax atrisoli TaxID=3394203 RepID=UPI000F7F941E|nr:response regulator [Variovorax sp. 369]RTD94127.1 response regulator [Variovorax sp. 369]
MRLDFTILWIDDQPQHIRSFEEGLRNALDALGFKLTVIPVAGLDAVDATVSEHVHDDAIDLVLVDYDLNGKGTGGEEALLQVRKKLPFKDVIFYSGTDVKKLREIAYNAGVDGIYFSSRPGLVGNATKAIQKLLSKVMDLDHMRGVVMSASSDIDFVVERSLLKMHDALDEAERAALHAEIVAELREKLKKWSDELEKVGSKGDFASLMKKKHIFTASDRLGSLLKRLASWEAEHDGTRSKVDNYINGVVQRRNKLAHAMLRRQDGKLRMVGMEQNWTAEEMTALRRELIDHRDNFMLIAVLLDVSLD